MMTGPDKAALETKVAAYYGLADLEAKILAALEAQGVDTKVLKPADLTTVDEFHIGGRPATAALMEQLPLTPEMRVLDIGSGVGGAARYLAVTAGCHVTGIDLTQEFVDVATSLSHRVGLSDKTDFRVGSALALPFADASFDAAYTIHVAMNIADRPTLYAEAARVLKPGAIFAVYDVLQGPTAGGPHFPVPWASDPAASHLVDPERQRALLEAAGFTITRTRDRRQFGLDFFAEVRAKSAAAMAAGKPPAGVPLLMGPDFPAKIANLVRSMEEQRVGPWEFICRRR
jgi:ubiquinone/menaquinone biosynthesis C-methylase UbiE